ncbi:magnesium transporter NIPA-domain-containing protein [Gamsiella multidivaricata]|uniref:magnesium transporter NIPA-domain-containing protein n=1 Tax=Gamsiella multidivaricata TaxID=101098 RepID=UPI002220FD0A|nr:magnesium transporter NIPA-domain-containing protein [Gamsiella multidivaricata]KAG0370277.1 hypothetical protein BGZ54_007067 [Gamsiella multidivaricata]KAI7825344.1 magnesium transporter NIPA-domain-containing protein [Gamsiella multidivaricata]
MWPIDDFPEINVHSYIGVIIAITGNILISVALNVQKYAHNQLQPGANTDAKLLHTRPTYILEEDPISVQHDTQHLQNSAPYHDSSDSDDEDNRERTSIHSSQSSRCSRRSSLPSNHNSDTSVQTDTITAGPIRPDLEAFYTSDTASETEYLRSKAWWLGMTLMILGECGNFLAYGYAQASIVAPLGTVALVSNVILAPLMLKEPFRKRDLVGIVIAIIGTIVVVINSKESEIKLTPEAVVAALLQTQFIVYFIVCCVLVTVLISLSDTIGSEYIFIDLSVVAIFGGYTVLATKGISSLLSLSFYKMFTYPIAYLLVFVMVSTAVLQIKFLNKSLQRFDATQVIPTQFVLFTTSAIIGSGILYNDFDEMDFNKGFNFLTGCCMTFLGVYFITSHRDKDEPTIPTAAGAEWALAPQTQFTPTHHQRSSMDSYITNRLLYPQDQNRSELFMEQGRVPVQSLGYVIPQPYARPIRYSLTSESAGLTASVPLLGSSHRQSVAGSKEQVSFLTSSVNALAAVGSAVGTHHTALLSLESKYGRKGDERRGSIQSLGYVPHAPSRPPLGSRTSSANSGVFPTLSITNHPSSTSLVPMELNYGTSLQSTPVHPLRSHTGHTADSRFQTPHLQERSLPQDGLHKQPHRKVSTPHMSREHKETKGTPSSLRIKAPDTAGVAVPRRNGDRHMLPSPDEHDSLRDIAQSLDSASSSTPKASSKFLLAPTLSSSPANQSVQGSENTLQSLRSPTAPTVHGNYGHKNNISISSNSSNRRGSTAASVLSEQGSAATLPPLPPLSDSGPQQHYPRRKKTRGSVVSSTYDSDPSSMPLQQTKRNQSSLKDEGGSITQQ